MDNSLHDDVWKDSFDKLLESRRSLRELNAIKKDVDASFNMDSSVDNSNYEQLISQTRPTHNRKVDTRIPSSMDNIINMQEKTFSTPLLTRCSVNPFQCPISPIHNWKCNSFKSTNHKKIYATNNIRESENDFECGKNQQLKTQDRLRKQVCFDIVTAGSHLDNRGTLTDKKITNVGSGLSLGPGKWRKSLNTWLRNLHCTEKFQTCDSQYNFNEKSLTADRSIKYMGAISRFSGRKSIFIKTKRRKTSIKNPIEGGSGISSKSEVLKQCNQRKPISFNDMLTSTTMLNCIKIGEGTYGEVFLSSKLDKPKVVLKIIPIEGLLEINGEVQKTFEQILPEILISKELSALREIENKINATQSFIQINKVSLVEGTYPNYLVKLWEDYQKDNKSENDHPGVFGESQLYIVLELQFAGEDFSSFKFTNAEQSFYALLQIIFALAVGEEAFQFEHRDLHLGNVLVLNTHEKKIVFKLNGKMLTVPTKGVKVTIIDYTLSRMTINDCCLYNDLSCDKELFGATGDYQYDIYRMMQSILKNNWSTYEPKTNIFWISFIVSKLIDGVFYKNTYTKLHKSYMQKLKNLQKSITNYNSAFDFVRHFRKLT